MEEREYKWLVQKPAFYELRRKFEAAGYAGSGRILQLNYYYDTPDLDYDRAGITIRIRQIEDRLTGTVKTHTSGSGSGLSLENCFKVHRLPASFNYKSDNLLFQGQLVTERRLFQLTDGVTVCFDKNYYLGCLDYEIELEYAAERETAAFNWYTALCEYIKKHDRDTRICRSKSDRFFRVKKNMLF